MSPNVGSVDRLLRLAAGLLIFILGMVFGKWWAMIIGLVVLFTSIFRWCPAYLPLGINTGKKKG